MFVHAEFVCPLLFYGVRWRGFVACKALSAVSWAKIGISSDFMFQLTKEECLRSQIVTSNVGRGGSRYMPYAFTENGVAMLSSVLRSERAMVNIRI